MRISQVHPFPDAAWEIQNDHLKVCLTRDGLNLTVQDTAGGKCWQMEPERQGYLRQKRGRQMFEPLEDLGLTEWRQAREGRFAGVELRSVQTDPWHQFKVRVRVLLAEDAPELSISVEPNEDPGYNSEGWVREVYYPRSFVHSDSHAACTVLPFQQGTLLPGDWPQAYVGAEATRLFTPWLWEAGTGPWWGHVDEGGAGYLAVIDTPDDAGFDLAHPAGGPTRVAPYWLTSFEALRYRRRMLYRFFPRADHAVIALAYRDYCRGIGRWRSIEEKRLEKPQLDKLRGAIGAGRPQRSGGRYRPRVRAVSCSLQREPIVTTVRTFHDIAKDLDAIAAEYPDENIYALLAGWQTLGYDHVHPAACPPNAEAGGWDGMRQVSDAAERNGMLFGVHEQYRDFFYSSPFWSEARTRKDSRRDSPRHSYWCGGTQSVLCPTLMLDFVKMNTQQLRDQKIRLNAAYHDVMTAMELEECFDPDHPATRTRCRQARNDVLEYITSLGWLIASESASDWAAPVLDYINIHWPRLQAKAADSEPVGIPVPLFSLVFHDCAILHSGATPKLIAALGGANTLQPDDRVLRALHKQVAYMPLTAHRLLSDDGRKQESVFGDSVTVSADLAAGTYRITGLGNAELTGDLADGNM